MTDPFAFNHWDLNCHLTFIEHLFYPKHCAGTKGTAKSRTSRSSFSQSSELSLGVRGVLVWQGVGK